MWRATPKRRLRDRMTFVACGPFPLFSRRWLAGICAERTSMLIEPFPLILAFLPLSAYLLLIGMIRLVAAPVVTTGGRDLGALAVGISGLVAIGPAELFFPGPAAASMGAYVWLVLLLFYILAVSLVILSLPT